MPKNVRLFAAVCPVLAVACSGGGFYLVAGPEPDPANDVTASFDSTTSAVAAQIADFRYEVADSALDSLLQAHPLHPSLLALRAQSAFEQGDLDVGASLYREALNRARFDSARVLWSQVVGIATPGEYLEWQDGVPSDALTAWFQAFWARRDPDLFAGVNARVAEHFTRLRYARSNYALLDPGDLYHRSAEARALNLVPSFAERRYYQLCEGNLTTGLRIHPVERDFQKEGADRVAFGPDTTYVPLTMDLRNVDTLAARVGYNLATGLDDRGLMYLRFGPPQQIVMGATNFAAPDSRYEEMPAALVPDCTEILSSLERWVYPGRGVVRFSRPADHDERGGFSSENAAVFRPMNQEQFQMTELGLTEDSPTLPAPLEFGLWTAQFADRDDMSHTTVVMIATIDSLAAALVSSGEGVHVRAQTERGVIALTERPGEYTLVAHGRSQGELGRKRGGILLRSFHGEMDVSDVLLARAWDSPVADLEEMVRRVRRDLTFRAGETVRTFAEVYGLDTDGDDETRFRVTYSLIRVSEVTAEILEAPWPEATRFEFDRTVPSGASAIVQTLDISPQHTPAGRYLLRIEVTDPANNRTVRTNAAAFRVVSE